MNSTSSVTSGLSPSYRIHVYHPDTRSLLSLPLQVLLDRIHRALKVEVDPRWLPTLVAMADGLFMQPESIARQVSNVAPLAGLEPSRARKQVPAILETLEERQIVEKSTVETLYYEKRLRELNHPRVWELNSWWEKLYGAIPTRSHLDVDDDEELDIWEDGPVGLSVGKTTLPLGVEPERDDIRILLEKKHLSQYEPLYRLRLSWHR